MKYTNTTQAIIKPISGLLLSLALLFGQTLWQQPDNTAHAYTAARHGYVVARGLFKGPNGQNIFAVIGAKGEVIEEIGEAIGPLQDAVVMDAARYNAILLSYQNSKSQLGATAEAATVLSRSDYETTDFGSVEVPLSNLAQGATVTTESVAVNKGELYGQSKSILVRANTTIIDPRLLPKTQGNILFQAPIDLRQAQPLEAAIKSVLLNKDGQIIQTSEYNIGFKSNFFEDGTANFRDRNALGPVVGAEVDVGIRTLVPGYTNKQGIYGMFMTIPGCGLISYFWDFYITAKINYRDFDPEAREPIDYYWFGREDYEKCEASFSTGYSSQIGSSFTGSRDIFVDLIMLTGLGSLQNPLNGPAISEGPTQYAYTAPPLAKVAPTWLDLNQDRNVDAYSQPDANGNINIWLDGSPTNPDGTPKAPDFTRLADSAPDFTNQGLLQSISADDLAKTDLYVYRVSNGTLVVKKKGLRAKEVIAKDNGFYYDLWIPGPLAFSYFGLGTGGTSETKAFQEAIGLPPELIGLRTDNLRAGEQLKLIAINRATGYMGSVTTTIQSPSDGLLDFPIDKLVLQPPNLKIKVDRIYNVQAGLTKGDKKQYQIGFEGSALTSDTLISIHSEWFEPDGTPLPETLEGFTGRLAKVTGANSLAGGSVNTFEISPGSKRQVVKLEGDILGTEHFYVHVFGTSEWDVINGAGTGPLQYRPDHYVPVKVPVFDEAATTKLRNLNAYNQQDGLSGVENVPAVYQWPYRPEMQFSVFDLTVNAINRMPEGSTSGTPIINADSPLINVNDQYVELLYQLLMNQNDPLDPLGAERQLTFALGESEQRATGNTELTFAELQHLAQLSGEDFLTLRLFQNSDAENVLWEFAFGLSPEALPYTSFVTADDASVELAVYLPETNTSQVNVAPKPVTLRWEIEGATGGSLSNGYTTTTNGIFTNTLFTSRTAEDEYMVKVTIMESEKAQFPPGTEYTFGPFIVTPGQPAQIELSSDLNELPSDTLSTATINLLARDAHGNLIADNTPVQWQLDYDGELIDGTLDATTNGEATAVYKVGDKTLPTTVLANIGNVESSFVINKRTLQVALTATTNAIQVGSPLTITLTATVTDPGGAAVKDGIEVAWSQVLGEFVNVQETLVGGQATATLAAGNIPGDGMVLVNVAHQDAKFAIQHQGPTTGTYAALEHAAIVAAATDGAVTVDTLAGTGVQTYITSTNITVYGTPGEQLSLSAGGFYTPNAKPTLHFAMNGLTQNVDGIPSITDIISGVEGRSESGGVVDDRQNSFTQPGSSLRFNGGRITVDSLPGLEINDDLFINLRFRTTSTNAEQILITKEDATSTAYTLKLINGGTTLEGTVVTDTGTYSTQIATPVQPNQWYIAGLRIRNGSLEIGLNEQRASTAITGILQGADTPITIGYLFGGNIDDVKLGRESSAEAIVQLAGGSTQNITLDASGAATLAVSATGQQNAPGQRIGFSITQTTTTGQNETNELTILNFAASAAMKMMGISTAYAAQEAGEQEAGLAVTDPESWGYIVEFVGKRFFGENFDKIKRAAIFVYELTSISDVVTLVKNIVALIKGGDDFDGFETTFAVIGIAITIAAVFTGGAAIGLKFGLAAIKPVLKELFATGIRDILKVMVVAGKYLFRLIKEMITDPDKALKSLKELADGFIALVKDTSGVLFKSLYKIVRSPLDLVIWLRIVSRGNKCFVSNEYNGFNRYRYAGLESATISELLQQTAYSALVFIAGKPAYAATCIDPMTNINAILEANSYALKSRKVARDMLHTVALLQDMKINVTDDMLKGMESFSKLVTVNSKNTGTLTNIVRRYAQNAGSTVKAEADIAEIFYLINRYDSEPVKSGVVGNISRLGAKIGTGVNENNANAVRYTLRYFESSAELRTSLHGFEVSKPVESAGTTIHARRYDAVTKTDVDVDFEIKDWSTGSITWRKRLDKLTKEDLDKFKAGDKSVSGEEVEWLSDVIKHAPDFNDLRWIINSEAVGKKANLKNLMVETLENPKYESLLADSIGIDILEQTIENLKRNDVVFDKFVKYVKDDPVKVP